MEFEQAAWALILLALVAANLPWFSDRLFWYFRPAGGKRFRHYLLEWVVMLLLMAVFALAIEYRLQGNIHKQSWEFYVATFCIFLVFAFPGFLYRYQIRPLLERRRRRKA